MTPAKPDAAAAGRREVELDLERVILRDLPLDQTAAKVWAVLSPSDFASETHGRVYTAWRGLAQDGEPLSFTTLTVRLADQLELCGGIGGVLEALTPHILDGTHEPGWGPRSHTVLSLARTLKLVAAERALRRAAQRVVDDPTQTAGLVQAMEAAGSAGKASESWSQAAYSESDFAAREYPKPVNLLGDGLLCKGDLGILYGKPKLGKSWLALMLARAAATGKPWLGISGPAEPARVCFVSLEIKARRLQERLKRLRGDDPQSANLYLLARPDLKGPVNLLDDSCFGQVKAFVSGLALDLIVIDATSRTHTADENDGQAMAELLARCDRLGLETGCAVLLIHHERKSDPKANGKEDDLDALRGSSRFLSDPTLLMRLKRRGGLLQLVCAGANNGPEFDPVWLAPSKHGPPAQVEAPEKRAEGTRALVLGYLQAASGWVSAAECGAAIGRSADTVTRHFEAVGCERSTDLRTGRRYRLSASPILSANDDAERDNQLGLN
jgi:hypothetical protein